MICKPYPHLGECVYEKVLPNGLLIRVVPKKGFAKTHAFFAVNYGSIDQDFILNGVSYLTKTNSVYFRIVEHNQWYSLCHLAHRYTPQLL